MNLHLYTWDYAEAAESGHTEVMTVLLARGLDGAGDPRVKIFLNHVVMMSAKGNSNPEILRMCDAMHTAHSKSPSDALAFMRKHIPGVVRERDRMRGEEAAAGRAVKLQAERAQAELLAERARAEVLARKVLRLTSELEAEEAAAGRGAGGGGDAASSSSSSSSQRKKKKNGGRGVHAGTSDAGAAGADTREPDSPPQVETLAECARHVIGPDALY